jgi:hypothetical protein
MGHLSLVSSFRCYPRFATMGEEIAMTHGWTILCSIVIGVLNYGMIHHIMAVRSSHLLFFKAKKRASLICSVMHKTKQHFRMAKTSVMSTADKTGVKVIQKLLLLGGCVLSAIQNSCLRNISNNSFYLACLARCVCVKGVHLFFW